MSVLFPGKTHAVLGGCAIAIGFVSDRIYLFWRGKVMAGHIHHKCNGTEVIRANIKYPILNRLYDLLKTNEKLSVSDIVNDALDMYLKEGKG